MVFFRYEKGFTHLPFPIDACTGDDGRLSDGLTTSSELH